MPDSIVEQAKVDCRGEHSKFKPVDMKQIDDESSVFDSSSNSEKYDSQSETYPPPTNGKKLENKPSIFEDGISKQVKDKKTQKRKMSRTSSEIIKELKSEQETVDESKQILNALKQRFTSDVKRN